MHLTIWPAAVFSLILHRPTQEEVEEDQNQKRAHPDAQNTGDMHIPYNSNMYLVTLCSYFLKAKGSRSGDELGENLNLLCFISSVLYDTWRNFMFVTELCQSRVHLTTVAKLLARQQCLSIIDIVKS